MTDILVRDIDALVAENARLRALLAAAAPQLRFGFGTARYCAMCGAYDDHEPDCLVALIDYALK